MASMVVKTFLLLFLFFTCPSSEGANSPKEDLKLANPCGLFGLFGNTKYVWMMHNKEVIVQSKVMRKLLGMETLSDYAGTGPNPRHLPPPTRNPGGRASANP